VFWVISAHFNIRNTLPKSGTFFLGHPLYQCTLERTDAITNEVLEPITFVLAYPTVLLIWTKTNKFCCCIWHYFIFNFQPNTNRFRELHSVTAGDWVNKTKNKRVCDLEIFSRDERSFVTNSVGKNRPECLTILHPWYIDFCYLLSKGSSTKNRKVFHKRTELSQNMTAPSAQCWDSDNSYPHT